MMAGLKKYPDMKDSGVEWLGDVPEHWEVRRLKTLLAVPVTDGPHSTPDFLSQGIPFLSVDSLQNGELVFKNCRYVSPEDHAEFKRKTAPRFGDILLGKAASTGKIARVKVDFEFSIWSPLALIRPDVSLITSAFLENALKDVSAQAQIETLCTLNTQKNISMDDIPKLVLPHPPLPEQAAIVRYLNYADRRVQRYIRAKQKLIKLLEEQKQAIIHRAVTRGLDPDVPMKDSGVEWLGEVPDHWEVARLRNVTKSATSGSRGWSSYASDEGPLFIRIANLDRMSLNLRFDNVVRLNLPETSETIRTRIHGGDLLISITAYIGSIAVVPDNFEEAYVSQHVARCPMKDSRHNPRWLGYVLLSEVGQTHGQLSLYGGTKDGLSLDDVKNYPIFLPPRGEQDQLVGEIEREFGNIKTSIEKNNHKIELLNEYHTRLIADVVTGKVDVREAAANLPDEPEDLLDNGDNLPEEINSITQEAEA